MDANGVQDPNNIPELARPFTHVLDLCTWSICTFFWIEFGDLTIPECRSFAALFYRYLDLTSSRNDQSKYNLNRRVGSSVSECHAYVAKIFKDLKI